MKVLILTQNGCTKCRQLKGFLDQGLNARHIHKIEWVQREDDEERFMDLAMSHKIMATPALIHGDTIMRDPQPVAVTELLASL